MNIKHISGGVCAPQGFQAAGIHCGIRKNHEKKDLALIVSENKAAAACVYTQNLVQGAPIAVTKAHVQDGYAQAIIVNSGNANTCNENGLEIASEMCSLVEMHTKISSEDVVVASTGVIGQKLDITPIAQGMEQLVSQLGACSEDAAHAIMTTDLEEKEIAVSFPLQDTTCCIGAIAKGSGMINPNMATMLCFITTDVSITPALLQKALSQDVENSFNMVCVDGDTSTNDMVTVLANGKAGNPIITEEDEAFQIFCQALGEVTTFLSRKIAKDGEGATKLITCEVTHAADDMAAKKIAQSVIASPLVKTAMFGCDANWGRVLCAMGYAGASMDVSQIGVSFQSAAGSICVCDKGQGVSFSEEKATAILSKDEIIISIGLGDGDGHAVAWGCDLTYDYVKINGDYRT